SHTSTLFQYVFSLHFALRVCYQRCTLPLRYDAPRSTDRICRYCRQTRGRRRADRPGAASVPAPRNRYARPVLLRWCPADGGGCRSEEHTSELQSRENLVCRLL